jgi:hypothetical protein
VRVAAVASVALLLAGGLFFGKPAHSGLQDAADDFAKLLQPGDTVGIVDADAHFAYRFYFHLTHDGTQPVQVAMACNLHPQCPSDAIRPWQLNTTWILMEMDGAAFLPADYVRVPTPGMPADPAHPDWASLWRRTGPQ